MEESKPASRRQVRRRDALISLAAFFVAATGVVHFQNPPAFLTRPFERTPIVRAQPPLVSISPTAFGRSGEVRVRMALPGDSVEYPLEVHGDPTELAYQWVSVLDTMPADSVRPFDGARIPAPDRPGFYRLALVAGEHRQILEDLTLTVLIPFEEKTGPELNGYRIGTYLAEKLGGDRERPDGFVEVLDRQLARLPVSRHLKLGDLISRDGQTQWPRYLALDTKLLDKVELVLEELSLIRGDSMPLEMRLNVSAGYRTPSYNSTVTLAATNSRHQQGDAVDLAVDADGDGRFTSKDVSIVALAVERVERKHPDLVGGLGEYTSRRYNTPYAHIDARGRRARWRG